ncbi:uncharacterized protein LOC120289380 [Eucalyptus grandis]|uniref:uncharacterized protein LOC120289380 n=1 Tax=Eucalyptus grandis TaxID=71139 RepID=UPI00192EB944|nr:uncharacterized protein LOC120289380 [Eucalyptus grandis]
MRKVRDALRNWRSTYACCKATNSKDLTSCLYLLRRNSRKSIKSPSSQESAKIALRCLQEAVFTISSWCKAVNGNHALESVPVDPKWETIVKSSNVHHGHLRFSEELLPPISET